MRTGGQKRQPIASLLYSLVCHSFRASLELFPQCRVVLSEVDNRYRWMIHIKQPLEGWIKHRSQQYQSSVKIITLSNAQLTGNCGKSTQLWLNKTKQSQDPPVQIPRQLPSSQLSVCNLCVCLGPIQRIPTPRKL